MLMNTLSIRGCGGVAILSLALAALTACSSEPAPAPAVAVGEADGVVTIYGAISGREAELLEESWAGWEESNGIDIRYEASGDFESQIGIRAQSGNAPDLAIFRQPGFISDLASLGYVQPAPAGVAANVKKNWLRVWADYGSTDGVLYAAPLTTTLEGLIWYSPSQFTEWGVDVPGTWNELMAVTEKIRVSEVQGRAVWCAGFASDSSSGSVGTDWVETIVIRQSGVETYDKWVNHEIAFNDPAVVAAFDAAGSILLDGNMVNAGLGRVDSINTSSLSDVAAAMTDGSCALHHQSSSFASYLEASGDEGDVEIAEDGDIWAFLAPGMGGAEAVTVGGDFLAAFSNDADTVKVQEYLSTSTWAMSRMALGGVLSTNRSVVHDRSPILQLAHSVLERPGIAIRFDASDTMPAVVGAGSFVTGMTDWIDGKSSAEVLASVEDSWPRD